MHKTRAASVSKIHCRSVDRLSWELLSLYVGFRPCILKRALPLRLLPPSVAVPALAAAAAADLRLHQQITSTTITTRTSATPTEMPTMASVAERSSYYELSLER